MDTRKKHRRCLSSLWTPLLLGLPSRGVETFTTSGNDRDTALPRTLAGPKFASAGAAADHPRPVPGDRCVTTVCRAEQLFSLDMLVDHLAGFQPPQGDTTRRAIGSIATACTASRTLTEDSGVAMEGSSLRGPRREGGRCSLHVAQQRLALGRFATGLRRTSRLATNGFPRQWSGRAERDRRCGREKFRGKPSSMHGRAAGRTRGHCRPKTKSLRCGPITINWLLFEAVGRLPHEAFPPLRFTLVDNFDQLKPGHWLDYVEKRDRLAGQAGPRRSRPILRKTPASRAGARPSGLVARLPPLWPGDLALGVLGR